MFSIIPFIYQNTIHNPSLRFPTTYSAGFYAVHIKLNKFDGNYFTTVPKILSHKLLFVAEVYLQKFSLHLKLFDYMNRSY